MKRMIWTGCALLALLAGEAAAAMSGKEIMDAFQYCRREAEAKCANNSIRCVAYRRSFIKACMIQIGAPADEIRLLLEE